MRWSTLCVASVLATLATPFAAGADAAARQLPVGAARGAAASVVVAATRVEAHLRLGRCARYDRTRVDCEVDRGDDRRCALVVSARPIRGSADVLTRIYGCPLRGRPTHAQRTAARAARGAWNFLVRCPLSQGVLFCPPGYGSRPDPHVAILIPGAATFWTGPAEPLALTMAEARIVAESFDAELRYKPTKHYVLPLGEVEACRRVSDSQIDCEILHRDDPDGEPICFAVRMMLRDDRWIAANPYGCPVTAVPNAAQLAEGRVLADSLIARRASSCLGPTVEIWPGVSRRGRPRDPECTATWLGREPSFVGSAEPVRELEPQHCCAGFAGPQVCWRKRVGGRRKTVCARLGPS